MAPDKYKEKLEGEIRENKNKIMTRFGTQRLAGRTRTKENIVVNILAALQNSGSGKEVTSQSGELFIFYPPATVVRDPSTGSGSPASIINGKIENQPDIPPGEIDIRAHTLGNDRGFFVLKDGTVVIEMPASGKVEYFADGQAQTQTLSDDGWNYKC